MKGRPGAWSDGTDYPSSWLDIGWLLRGSGAIAVPSLADASSATRAPINTSVTAIALGRVSELSRAHCRRVGRCLLRV